MYTVVKNTKTMGRGLYAAQDIEAGKTFIENQILILKKMGELERYVFDYKDQAALAMGDISFTNHSETETNCRFFFRKNSEGLVTVRLKTTRPIKAGEQLFIDYGYDPVTYVFLE